MGLDLPEETFVEKHGFSSIGETWRMYFAVPTVSTFSLHHSEVPEIVNQNS